MRRKSRRTCVRRRERLAAAAEGIGRHPVRPVFAHNGSSTDRISGRNDDRSKQLVRLPRRNEIRSSESEDDSEESTVDSYPNHRDDGRAHASHPLNHGFQTRNAAAPKPTTQDYWTLDYAAQKYYHDDVEKGIRHFPDGKTEYLAPPTPSAPVMKWDTRNQDWYWRDDFNKCWRYSRGLVIDYPAE